MAVILKICKCILSYLILSQATVNPIIEGPTNFMELMRLSLLFFETQRSGKLPTNNNIPWRGDSALNDRGDNGEDLTGGYYDGAADYVKQSFSIAYTITMLSWTVERYQAGYRRFQQYYNVLEAIKWGTDYLIKCHVAPRVFYAQVGNFQEDHEYWGRPEDLNMTRPAYKIDKDRPGSDIAAEASAALAVSSMVFRGRNRTYYKILLSHSRQLFELARNHRGRFLDTYPINKKYFENEDFRDELMWAAVWLYRATRCGRYGDFVKKNYDKYKMGVRPKSFFYNTKTAAVQIIMAQLFGSKYKADANAFCNYMMHKQTRTPRGLVYIDKVGTLAHAANIAFICLQVGEFYKGRELMKYVNFAKQQVHYIIGEHGFSFLVGYGQNYPKQPCHESSSCQDRPAPCGWDDASSSKPNPQIAYGALVSGPNQDDYYMDVRQEFHFSEVKIDYNVGFQNLLVALSKFTF